MSKRIKNNRLPWILTGIVILLVVLFLIGWSVWKKSQIQPVPEFVLNGIMRQIKESAEPLSEASLNWIDEQGQNQNYSGKGLIYSGLASKLNPAYEAAIKYLKENKFKANETNASVGSLESVVAYQYKSVACLVKTSLAGADESLGVDDLRKQIDASETLEIACFSLK